MGYEDDASLVCVDRLSPLKRDLMKRRLKKRVREGWEK